MKRFGFKVWHYAILGFAFGAIFPLIAYYLRLIENDLSFTLSNIIELHHEMLFYIIDLAPIILGLLFMIIGKGAISKLNYLISIAQIERNLRDETYDPQRFHSLKKIRKTYFAMFVLFISVILVCGVLLIRELDQQRSENLFLAGVCEQVRDASESNSSDGSMLATVIASSIDPISANIEAQQNRNVTMIVITTIVVLFLISFIIYLHFFAFAPNFIGLQKVVYENSIAKKMIQDQGKENKDLLEQLEQNLNTAHLVQKTLNLSAKKMKSFFNESFVIDRPLQILSGDFIWFRELDDDNALICLGDCVGHGVAGSLLSGLYISFLDEITETDTQPDKIILALDEKIKSHISSIEANSDNFTTEAGILLVNKKEKRVEFAGSNTDLLIQNGKVELIRSEMFGIGSHRKQQAPILRTFEFHSETWLMLSSDGMKNMIDKSNNRLGLKGINEFFNSSLTTKADDYKSRLESMVDNYLKDAFRNDDILICGIKLS